MAVETYRSVARWSGETAATAWKSSHHHARIGDCDATIKSETPRRLAPYFRWSVTREQHVTLSGTAQTLTAAMDACERAAEILSGEGWPTAFTQTGKLEARRG